MAEGAATAMNHGDAKHNDNGLSILVTGANRYVERLPLALNCYRETLEY